MLPHVLLHKLTQYMIERIHGLLFRNMYCKVLSTLIPSSKTHQYMVNFSCVSTTAEGNETCFA